MLEVLFTCLFLHIWLLKLRGNSENTVELFCKVIYVPLHKEAHHILCFKRIRIHENLATATPRSTGFHTWTSEKRASEKRWTGLDTLREDDLTRDLLVPTEIKCNQAQENPLSGLTILSGEVSGWTIPASSGRAIVAEHPLSSYFHNWCRLNSSQYSR